MFGTSKSGANAYAKVGLETGVTGASPHKLIVMLFDGALVALTTAQQHMKDGNIQEKGKAISKAIMIIDGGLRASLNKQVGGQIATSLDALYEYMSNRLLIANLRNQPEILDEIHRLLEDLKSAWVEIGANGDKPTAVIAAAAAASVSLPPVKTVTDIYSARLAKA
jgi:flagellar protein FliS